MVNWLEIEMPVSEIPVQPVAKEVENTQQETQKSGLDILSDKSFISIHDKLSEELRGLTAKISVKFIGNNTVHPEWLIEQLVRMKQQQTETIIQFSLLQAILHGLASLINKDQYEHVLSAAIQNVEGQLKQLTEFKSSQSAIMQAQSIIKPKIIMPQ